MKLLLLLSLLFTGYTYAQQPTLSGRITDKNNTPIPYANILLKNTSYGAITDETGKFELKAVPGTYTLAISSIGYTTYTQKTTIGTNPVDLGRIVLDSQTETLYEVTVTSSQKNGFANKKTDYVARMPLSNLENPQVYSIVSKELMEEQLMTDIKEPLRSAPGVAPANYVTGMFMIVSRGFKTWYYARNGLATSVGRSGTEIVNLERIELIKGPSGTLFGSQASSFGGVLNLVTKKPQEEFSGQAGYNLGSFDLSRFTLDINTPLNEDKTLLFRLNAVHHKQNSFNEFGKGKRLAVAPSLAYKASDRLTFLFDVEYYKSLSTRLPYTLLDSKADFSSFNDIPQDFDKSFYLNDLESDDETIKYFMQARYDLGNNWTSTTDVSHVNEYVGDSYQPYNQWITRDSVIPNIRKFSNRDRTSANIQQNFNGSFHTGKFRHKLLIGASYEYVKESQIARISSAFDTISIEQPYQRLGKTQVNRILDDPAITPLAGEADQNAFGVYVSDVIQWTDRLSTMLSLRWDRFERKGNDSYTQNSFSPKLGIIYQPVKDKVSLFANYTNGFQNQAPRDQPDGSIFVPDPVYANQLEGGVKTELLGNRLNATVSYYHIGIDNSIRVSDDLFTVQDGKQVSQGVEVELIANPVKGLRVVTGYGYNENKIVRAAANEGKLLQGAPQHMVNYWLSYRFSPGTLRHFGLGFGGNYVSDSYYNASNTMTIPAYHLLNATVFYEKAKWKIGLKFNNITDEEYWDGLGNQQFTRNFVANFSFRF